MIKKLVCWNLLCLCLFFLSCSKSKRYEFVSDKDFATLGLNKPGEFHKWYSFTEDGFLEVQRCDLAPVVNKQAWTEAIRISSANFVENKKGKAYAIVNHLGILCFTEDQVELIKDSNVFTDRTAENLFIIEETPFFTLSKNAFFNKTINEPKFLEEQKNFFIMQYNSKDKVFYPVLNKENLLHDFFLPENAQITELAYKDGIFYSSIKYLQDQKVQFLYINFRIMDSLNYLNPSLAKKNVFINQIEEDEYRAVVEYKDFLYAPDSIKNLLNDSVLEKPFFIQVKNENSLFGTKYQNTVENPYVTEKLAYAYQGKFNSCVLFDDGTFFIQGCLKDNKIINEGKVLALRLPKLPSGFKYADFVLTNNILYAAWEENNFYETIRSGFIAVNLEKLVYLE